MWEKLQLKQQNDMMLKLRASIKNIADKHRDKSLDYEVMKQKINRIVCYDSQENRSQNGDLDKEDQKP